MKRIGGRAFKFMPVVKGNPDRIVVFPFGRIYFVELKRPKGKPSPAQVYRHALLFEMGHVVHIIDTRQMVDDFIRWAADDRGLGRTARSLMDEVAAAERHYKEEA